MFFLTQLCLLGLFKITDLSQSLRAFSHNALPTKVGQKRQKVQNGIVTDAIYIRDQNSQHWIRAAGLSYRVSTAKHLRSNSQKSILRATLHCVKELGEVISRGKQTFTTGNSQPTYVRY